MNRRIWKVYVTPNGSVTTFDRDMTILQDYTGKAPEALRHAWDAAPPGTRFVGTDEKELGRLGAPGAAMRTIAGCDDVMKTGET